MISKVISLCALVCAAATASADVVQDRVNQELTFIKGVYETNYAPTAWKESHFGWSLDAEYQKATAAASSKANMTAQDYRRILRGFLASTHDYHVGIQFFTTEASSLPFSVSGVNGHYYIVWIDRTKLNQQVFPFQVGDELISFDGRPVADIVAELKSEISWSIDGTDQRLAELMLTRRSAQYALNIPNGPVVVRANRADAAGNTTVIERQMAWTYTPESVEWNPSATAPIQFEAAAAHAMRNDLHSPQMAWGMWDQWSAANPADANPFGIGGRTSWVPRLGTPIWQSDTKDEFDAYIYQNAQGKLIGYIRIPSYEGLTGQPSQSFLNFKAVIKRFQATTDAMVIDEVNNPGGSLFYISSLLSVLSPTTMQLPPQAMSMNPSMIADDQQNMEQLRSAKTDADVQQVFGGDNLDGYPVTFELGQLAMKFFGDTISQWHISNGPLKMTTHLAYYGVDKVNPDPAVHYSKPILILVNELDFSGGDFFPAIMQDNQRAKIFGQRTSGAGGYIIPVQVPSSLGLKQFTFTGSIAQRVNKQPIENLGVTPDIPYQVTATDIETGFSGYRSAVNTAVQSLISGN